MKFIYLLKLYIYIDQHFNNIASIPVGYDNIAYMYILVNHALFYQRVFCVVTLLKQQDQSNKFS